MVELEWVEEGWMYPHVFRICVLVELFGVVVLKIIHQIAPIP
jgi:hypothetical protein